jgi:hypothetical protein
MEDFINQGCFTVVNVSNDGNISNIHSKKLSPNMEKTLFVKACKGSRLSSNRKENRVFER